MFMKEMHKNCLPQDWEAWVHNNILTACTESHGWTGNGMVIWYGGMVLEYGQFQWYGMVLENFGMVQGGHFTIL